MAKAEVFLFRKFDVTSGKTVLSKQYATRKAIESLSATPVEESKIEVEPSELDGNGMYKPRTKQ